MEAISTTHNPLRGEEYILSFEVQNVLPAVKNSRLELRYVPDREIVTDENFHFWLNHTLEQKWQNAEELGGAILSAFYNSVLPFYVDIHIHYDDEKLSLKRKLNFIKTQPNHKLSEFVKEQLI